MPRVCASYQYNWLNSSPPLSLVNTKPWRHALAGEAVMPTTGSLKKLSCSRIPKGSHTRCAWAVSAKRVLMSMQPLVVQPANAAPRVFWYWLRLSISSGGISGRFSLMRLPASRRLEDRVCALAAMWAEVAVRKLRIRRLVRILSSELRKPYHTIIGKI